MGVFRKGFFRKGFFRKLYPNDLYMIKISNSAKNWTGNRTFLSYHLVQSQHSRIESLSKRGLVNITVHLSRIMDYILIITS